MSNSLKVALVLLIASWALSTATSSAADVERRLSGLDISLVEASLVEVRAKIPAIKIEEYRVEILEGDESYTIVFHPLERPESYLGSLQGKPSVEVVVSKKNLKIVDSYFLR